MKTQFTPGPWMLAPSSIENENGMNICNFEVGEGMTAEVFQNANLISAAPELYESANLILGALTSEFNIKADGTVVLNKTQAALLLSYVEASLKKSRGES